MHSNLLIVWMREHIQLYDTFLVFFCGVTTLITTSTLLLSEPCESGTRTRKRKTHPEQALQLLNGHPGMMELIGDYLGVIRGKELRMLQEFNDLVIDYYKTPQSSSPSSDKSKDNAEDY